MKKELNINETIKISKGTGDRECDHLFFRLWQKNGKSRVYINDYKNRTLGYIDTITGEVEISNKQGCFAEDIEFALNSFIESYMTEETVEETVEETITETDIPDAHEETETSEITNDGVFYIYDKETREIVAEVVVGGKTISLGEALEVCADEFNPNAEYDDPDVKINGEWYFTSDLEFAAELPEAEEVNLIAEETTEEIDLIEKYEIELTDNGKLQFHTYSRADAEFIRPIITTTKPRLVEILTWRREREEKVNAIEGLAELRETISKWGKYYTDLQQHNIFGDPEPTEPETTVESLEKKYPLASAYIKAEKLEQSSRSEVYEYDDNEGKIYNDTRNERGIIAKKAIRRLLNGEDPAAVIADMDKQYNEYAEKQGITSF